LFYLRYQSFNEGCRKMTVIRTIIGSMLALALAALSIACCYLFGSHLAPGLEGQFYGVLGAVADGLKAILPLSIAAAFAVRARFRALIGALLFACFSTWSFVSEIGLYSLSRDSVTASSAGTKEAYEQLKAERSKIATRLAALGTVGPSATVSASISAAHQNRLWQVSSECKEAVGVARAFCADLDRLTGERASAIEAEKLLAQDHDIAVKMGAYNLADVLKSADAQSEALARFTGFSPASIRDALAVMIAALVELGSGFGLYAVASSGTATPGRGDGKDRRDERPASGQRQQRSNGKRKTCPVKAFLAAACTKQTGAEVASGILFNAYLDWSKGQGEAALSSTGFGRRMSELKHVRNKRGGVARYQGLTLREGARLRIVG
jgi:hypothetical protein